MLKQYKVGELRSLEDNPRVIDTFKYQTLIQSIKDFPEMLSIRPILIDPEHNILCGNMRYRAAVELGMETIPAMMVELPEDKRRELIIKDNVSYGEWNEEALENHWASDPYNKWLGYQTFDYSQLEFKDLSAELDDKANGVRQSIHIDFGEHYEEAYELQREARKHGLYLGGLFISMLNSHL